MLSEHIYYINIKKNQESKHVQKMQPGQKTTMQIRKTHKYHISNHNQVLESHTEQ